MEEGAIPTLHANFQGKTNVLQISPAGRGYNWAALLFYLREYVGQEITIEVSMQVWLERPSKVVWQINNDDYPVIAGDYTTLSANQWHTVQGSRTLTVASSSPTLYLNAPETLANVTAYIADLTVTVNGRVISGESFSIDASLPALHTKWPFPIGTALNYESLFPVYPQHQLLRHVNVLGAENIFKPEHIMPSPWTPNGAYRWDSTDRLVNLAEANGQKIRGHVLFWHEQTPEAFFRGSGRDGLATADELYTRMERHAKTVFEKYGGRIEWWDVHNEVVGETGNGPRTAGAAPPLSRYTQIMEAAGKSGMDRYEFVLKAFQFARQYADANGGRNVKLILNEYFMELPSGLGAKHTEFLRLLDYLIANNAPIDGVGIQGNYHHDWPNVRDVSRGIDAITSKKNPRTGRNLTVQITEMEISIFKQNETNWNNLSASTKTLSERELNTRLTQQGRRYREFFDMFEQKHREGKLDLVVIWGMGDSESFLNYHFVIRTDYPLLFNRNFQPKPAFSELIRGR